MIFADNNVSQRTRFVDSKGEKTKATGGQQQRLGVYIDAIYRVSNSAAPDRISTDRSFLLFVCDVGTHFDQLVLFGRALPTSETADYVLPANVRLVPLPYYANLRRLVEVVRALGGTIGGFWRGLPEIDVVWVFGPHPFAVALAVLALARGKRVVLGVRQDSVQLYRARVRGWKRAPAVAVFLALDTMFRALARRVPVTVQGAELARRYGGERRGVLPMTESVIRARDVARELRRARASGEFELLTVGRFEPEKNPLLLVEAIAKLERLEPGRYRLVWVGRGPLEDEVRRRAAELGLDDRVQLRGYVRFDNGLLDLYREADAFVHVSLTEGVPKVILEAHACGTPVIATDVGGVRATVDGGRAALLVPPGDADALVAAVRRLAEDGGVRAGIATRGLELARERTLEAEAGRVVRFLRREE